MKELGDLSPAELRTHLHRVADWIADYRERLESLPINPDVQPGDVRACLPTELPAEGVSMEALLSEFERIIVPAVVHWGHPRFLAYFGSTTTAPGIIAEALTAALNVSAMMWSVSPAATELEQSVLDWLRQLLGLPASFVGMVHDTASVGTLHALAAARELAGRSVRRDGLAGQTRMTLYVSDQAHSSIDKAAIVLGIGESCVRRIPTDDRFRMLPAALSDAIASDLAAGANPCAVVATVGTTSTAAVDPVRQIASICQQHDIWLHVDAAYGGAMAVLPEGRWVMDGVEQADSVVVNPHKWLFVPLDFSTLYTRRPEAVRLVFTLTPSYLEGNAGLGPADAMEMSLQLGRRFRALKAWMVWRCFGAAGLAARIREHVRLARLLAEWIESDADFELAAPVTMGVVCFRIKTELAASAADELHEDVVDAVNRRGVTYLTHTRSKAGTMLRIALGNISTSERHLAESLAAVRTALGEIRRSRAV